MSDRNPRQNEADNDNDEQEREQNRNSTRVYSPNSFPELIWLLITTKEGWFGIFIIALITTWLIPNIVPKENRLEIEFGKLTIVNEGARETILSLSPTGGEDSAWVETGIKVKKGDSVRITASGRINTQMGAIVTQALQPGVDEPTWVGPSGLKDSDVFYSFPLYNKKKLLPDEDGAVYGFGMLLAAVQNSQKKVEPESIQPYMDNEAIEFIVEEDGELVLTVNDIWLNENSELTYAPEPKDRETINYYKSLIRSQASFDGQNFDLEDITDPEAKEQYNKRKEDWLIVQNQKNWDIWYDDNIGAFSVAITVNPI